MGNKFSEYSAKMNTKNIHNDTSENKHNNTTIDTAKNIEDMYNKYSQYSESDLMQEFIKQSMGKRAKGELNDTMIDTYRKTLYPYLTDAQKETFENLMNVVK